MHRERVLYLMWNIFLIHSSCLVCANLHSFIIKCWLACSNNESSYCRYFTVILSFTQKYDFLVCFMICVHVSSVFLGFSLLIPLAINFDRYLAITYPFFHRTSVTKERLVTFSSNNSDSDFCEWRGGLIQHYSDFISGIFLSSLFFNYKLYMISRHMRKSNATTQNIITTIKLRNISSCLLAVACYMLFSIPSYE